MTELAEPGADHRPNIAEAVAKTMHDALELARAELKLAKREATAQARSVVGSAIYGLVGLMFFQAAITTLGVLLVLALRTTALGFAVVGGFLAVALVLGLVGIRVMKQHKLRSVARLKLDVREIAEAVK